MKMTLQVSIPCILGIYPHEKTRPIPLQCRIQWVVDESKEALIPLDYDRVYRICVDVLQARPFDWIEEATLALKHSLTEEFGNHVWQVELEKPLPYGKATCSLECS